MEIINNLAEFIGGHWWASIVLGLLYIGYEIAVRRIPTDSPYYSVIHTLGKGIKFLGKMVIKVIGENMSKTDDKDDKNKVVLDDKGKPKKLKHK